VRSALSLTAIVLTTLSVACVEALDIDGPITIRDPCIPKGEVCGTSPQCGCPASADGTPQSCAIDAQSRNACIPSGTTGLNQKCNSGDDCVVGLACLGVCIPFCTTNADCPASGQWECLPVVPGNSLRVCLSKCEPIDDTTCTAFGGLGCSIIPTADGAHAPFCSSANSATGACIDGDCAPGYSCTNEVCRKWCRLDSLDCSCVGFDPAVTLQGVEYGVCGD